MARTERVTSRAEALLARVQQRLGKRGMLVFSALSALWGLVSGISLKRDYEHSQRIVAYLALFVVASALFRIWLEYARRLQERATPVAGLRGLLIAKPGLALGATMLMTQFAVQYIAMFCIPLLAFAGAWITLGLTVVLAGVSLIDPWWAKISAQPWCMAMVRCCTAVIATSFTFAVFWPQQLAYFYPLLGAVAVLSVLPWDLICFRTRRPHLADIGPSLLVGACVLSQASMNTWVRVPLLSVWLRHPELGTEVDEYELKQAWESVEPASKLAAALASEDGLCCVTPIVSPSGTQAAVTHEWLVDGTVVDRIPLTPIQGQGQMNHRSFHTYSCKHHLPTLANVHTLGCRVYLDDRIYLGRVDVSFR